MEIKKYWVLKGILEGETLALHETLETCYMIRAILLELYEK